MTNKQDPQPSKEKLMSKDDTTNVIINLEYALDPRPPKTKLGTIV